MAGDTGDEVRVARLGDAGSIAGPAARRAAARWDPVDVAGNAARVAAFPGPGHEDASGDASGDAAVADLASASPAATAAVAADLGSVEEPRAVRGHVARLGEPTAGRARHGSAGGSSGESARRRSRDAARPRPSRSASPDDGSTGTGATPAVGATPDTGRPPRRFGPKQIDPDADPVTAARDICLRLLTDRARTRHELAQALSRRGVPDDAATSVLERFDDVGLIDDAAFAGQFVRSRHNHRGLARRAIAMELRRKGVDDEVAAEALEDVDAGAESRRARELVDRKLRSLTVATPEQRTSAARRLVGMLARKGYGAGTAYGVVREALAAHGAEEDELGVEPVDD